MTHRTISSSAIACAMASILLVAPSLAQDSAETSRQSRSQATNEVEIPACLEHLSLKPQQEDQIRQIVREYDANLNSVWNQFASRYMETIEAEALLLAAFEDNLTDAQRTLVREQRRNIAQIAKHQKSHARPDDKSNEANDNRNRANDNRNQATDSRNQATDARNQATDARNQATEEEVAIMGVSLTEKQEAAADKLQEKCHGHLRSLNRDIHGLHLQLVSLETDKLVAIENVLTQEQVMKLREIRQNTPIEQKITDTRDSTPNSR